VFRVGPASAVYFKGCNRGGFAVPMHDWSRVEAGVYHDFHQEWAGQIKLALNRGILPAGYFAMLEQVTVRDKETRYVPDVLNLRKPLGDRPPGPTSAGLLTAPPKTKRVAVGSQDAYLRRKNVVTVHHATRNQVVAVVELVSPGNKAAEKPFDEFVRKAADLLDQGVLLLLIDPFPPTARDPNGIHGAIWEFLYGEPYERPDDQPLTVASYESSETGVNGYLEPIAAGDRLPDMPLYLQPGGWVTVPLEASYTSAWELEPLEFRQLVDPSA
jgi:hypothetical protein